METTQTTQLPDPCLVAGLMVAVVWAKGEMIR